MTSISSRSGGRAARLAARASRSASSAVHPGLEGGRYQALSELDMERIHEAVLEVLETVGMADATPDVAELALAHGCTRHESGRILFPRALVDDTIARAGRQIVMFSRDGRNELHVGGGKVHFATSGEAISILDPETRAYRPSTLLDIYDCARLVDTLEHIHQFGQTCVATEMTDPLERDVSIAYALAAGTIKTSGMSISGAKNLKTVIALYDLILGGEGRFVERPFCSIAGCCPVVSPLRFAEDSLATLVESVRLGLIGDIAIAGQAGATAPVTLAGALVQSLAETLACLCVVNMVRPGAPMMFGAWPFVSDLRTGSFTGGSGEQGLLMAAVAQMANFYDLPSSVAAGMSDAKLPDNQSGFEKGITTAVVALAGGNFISEAAGMQASLLGVSYEALVIDNDMLGVVQRTLRGIEVSDETLAVDIIREVALGGPGHFLGHTDTLAKMETEYLYPAIANRQSPDVWRQGGSKDIHEAARERVRKVLSTHYPDYIEPAIDAEIRSRFPIQLSTAAMQADSGRWTA
jgi:trimethylamine--corrinoid protein Co-methyltransferase